MAKYLYRMIADKIISDIKSGILPPSTNVPSSRDLCRLYKVSQITAMHALNYLEKRGILQHKAGQNFIVSRKLEEKQDNFHFLTLLFRHISTSGPEFYGNKIISGIMLEASSASIGTYFSANAARTIYRHEYDFSEMKEEALMLPQQNNIGFIADYFIQDDILKEIAFKTQRPIVVIGRASKLSNVHSVVLEPNSAYKALLNTLIRLGYDAFICCESHRKVNYENVKQHQFFKELTQYSNAVIISDFNNIPHSRLWEHLGNAIESLQGRHIAVLTASDVMAMSVIKILEQHEIKVPEQIGVVGFYGTNIFTPDSLKLTSISVSPENIGKMAAQLLISNDTRYQLHTIAMEFVFGETI